MFGMDIAVVYDKEGYKKIQNAEFDGVAVAHLKPTMDLLGHSALIFASKKEVHKRGRTILMRAFTPQAVESYLPQLERIMREFWASWAEKGRVNFGDGANSVFFETARKVGRRPPFFSSLLLDSTSSRS